MTIHELHDRLKKGEISIADIVRDVLKNIQKKEPQINAYISVFEEEAIERAVELENNMDSEIGVLYGIPIGVKDNIVTRGHETTCASKILLGYIPPYNATVVEKLLANGAIITGKTNMDEFAMGSSGEYSYFGPTRNPINTEYVPGGSSSGSAAAVASGEAIAALGSDTGGSVRLPAAFCGVVGFKPTYGTISRYGLIAFASSLDQIGFLTKDVTDAAILYSLLGGFDPHDSTSFEVELPHWSEMVKEQKMTLKIGVPKEFMNEKINPEIFGKVEDFISEAERYGHEIKEISLPHTEYAIETYYLIAMSEASSNLARYDGVRYGYRVESDDLEEMYVKTRTEGFGPEVKRRIMMGTFALSSGYYDAYYLTATKVRRLIKGDFIDAFKEVDVIIGPTSPEPPFKLGEKLSDPISLYMTDVLTVTSNLAGLPSISIPLGFNSKGLPIGVQVIGNAFEDVKLLNAAYNFEKIINS